MLNATYTVFSYIGKRERNEDATAPAATGTSPDAIMGNQAVFLVCDGVGGVPFGHVASQITAQTLYDYLSQCHTEQQTPDMAAGIQLAVAALHQYKIDNIFATGLNTTMTACYLHPTDGNAYLYHLGDSKIFLIRQGQIHYRSTDHNLYNAYLREGIQLSENNRNRHRLTRVIKPYNDDEQAASAHLQIEALQAGDYVLLCSDGVTESFTDEQLLTLIADPQTDICLKTDLICQRCEEFSKDNFSAILIQLSEEQAMPEEQPVQTKKNAQQ